MARKSGANMGRKKTAPPSKSIRIAEDVYDKSMIVAAFEKQDLSTFLSELLRPLIAERLRMHKSRQDDTEKD